MISTIKEKLKVTWQWTKRKVKAILITIGVIGVAYAATLNGGIPSVIAEGEVIEFPYTDENIGETVTLYFSPDVTGNI